MRLMIDGPGIPGHPGARRHAGKQHIELLALKAVVSQRLRITYLADSHRGAGKLAPDVVCCLRAV
jgi:hypothetical protein